MMELFWFCVVLLGGYLAEGTILPGAIGAAFVVAGVVWLIRRAGQ